MNKKICKEIITQVIIAIAIQAVFSAVGFGISYLNKEKVKITVCSSTKCEDGYYTCINIKNFQDNKSIESIIMWSDSKFYGDINYEELEVHNEKIIIKNISPSFSSSISVFSKEKITEYNTKFECDEKNVVEFLSNEKESNSQYWKQFIWNIISYVIVYGLLFGVFYVYDEKEKEKTKHNFSIVEQRCVNTEKKLEYVEEKLKEQRRAFLKVKIYLHNKIKDYAKELTFYRKTIQKLAQNSQYNGNIVEDVTKELKTYRTMEKIKPEDIELDVLGIEKDENDEIKKLLEE